MCDQFLIIFPKRFARTIYFLILIIKTALFVISNFQLFLGREESKFFGDERLSTCDNKT